MTYPGGKDAPGIYQTLINEIPPHKTFISACLGDCAIIRHIRPARRIIGIDPNADTLATWHARHVPGLELYHTTAQAFLAHFFGLQAWCPDQNSPKKHSEDFVFLDPPYPHSTRTKRRLYKYEMSDAQHAELLAVITRLPCPVMITTYDNPAYRQALHAWRTISYQTWTRGRTPRTETAYMNYPPPPALHDYAYIGPNKRARERIRRRCRNWTRILANLDERERGAVLQAIAQAFLPPAD